MRTSFLVTFEEGTAGRNDAARSFDRNTTTFYGSPAELRALRLERMRRSGSGIAICVEDTAGGGSGKRRQSQNRSVPSGSVRRGANW
ncbi:hypothetical protein DO73_4692 [Burkholderia pseudomallei]|nr:hypothetical protein DO73_4692 [Burkholderia pseudomallei]